MARNAFIVIVLMLVFNSPCSDMLMVEQGSNVEFLPQRIELQTPKQFQLSTSNGVSISDMRIATEKVDFMQGNQVQMTGQTDSEQNTNSRQPRRFVSTAPSTTNAQSTMTTSDLTQSPSLSVRNPPFSAVVDYKEPQPQFAYATYVPPHDLHTLTTAVRTNPVLTALLLSSLLGNRPHPQIGFNSPQPAPDPFVALFLSHYGRYIPRPGRYDGLYGYTAANNIHNTKPFGSYKIYDDSS